MFLLKANSLEVKMNTNAILNIPIMATCDTKNTTKNSNIPIEEDIKGNPTNLGLTLLGLAVIGTSSIMFAKKQADLANAKIFFDKYIQTAVGNNKALTSFAQNINNETEKFICENEDLYTKLQEFTSQIIEYKELPEIANGKHLYHGTNTKNAISILQNGITPYALKENFNIQEAGNCIHFNLDTNMAKNGDDGIILPYKFEGNLAQLNQKTNLKEFQNHIFTEILKRINFTNNNNPSNRKTNKNKASQITAQIINKLLQDIGYDGLYYLKKLPNNITSRQIAVYNGTKLVLDIEELKNINPISNNNCKKFL